MTLKARWISLSLPVRLIVINVAVFLVLRILGIIALIGGWDINAVIDCVALPSAPLDLAAQPWTALTYMITHYDPFHLLFNMLSLYWFGGILLMRCTPRQLTALYIYGGLAGAAFYVAAAQIFPAVAGLLLGASAAVIAILTSAAVLMPNFEVGLLLFGRVKLKWLAIGAIALFALGLVGNNAGGHVAHLGGMALGFMFAVLLNRGVDITRPLNKLLDIVANLYKRMTRPSGGHKKKFRPRKFASARSADSKTSSKHTSKSASQSAGNSSNQSATSPEEDRRILDEILDKVKRSGYSALTPDERRRLFDVSRRIK